jgi:hypothetical protein
LLLTTTVIGVTPGAAQSSGNGYFFRPPLVTLSLQGGLGLPRASSDLFTDISERLTINDGDFRGAAVNTALFFNINPRIAIGASLGYSSRTVDSEYRNFVEESATGDLPITQTTRFARTPIMAQAKLYLVPTGQQIGSFAWVPSKLAPYIGAGAGAVHYRFRQEGDFINFADPELSIFSNSIEADGWAPAAQLLGGVDYSLTPRILLSGEAGYTRASRDLPREFEGFEPIDLSSVVATVGISLRF